MENNATDSEAEIEIKVKELEAKLNEKNNVIMDLQTKAQYYEEEKNNAMKTLEEKMEMINKEHGEYQSLKDSIEERDNRIKELEQVVEGMKLKKKLKR